LFASDSQITPRLELLAGISNPTDRHYQNCAGRPRNPPAAARATWSRV